jgi:uncharacterized protein YqeY
MYKSAEETVEIINKNGGLQDSMTLFIMEILNEFRPKTLSEIAIRAIVVSTFNRLGKETPMGKFMGEFKSHEGMDMKIASAILKELLK